MKGIVTWIGVRDLKSKNIIPTGEVNAIKGKGLEGDKIFLKSSQKRQVTLIMSENINRLKKNHCSLLGNDKLHYVENYLKRNPNHIRVLDQISGLYLFKGEKEKAIEAKLKVYKFHELNKDKKKILSTKSWILSVDPTYFDEPVVIENIVEKILGYIEKEIEN